MTGTAFPRDAAAPTASRPARGAGGVLLRFPHQDVHHRVRDHLRGTFRGGLHGGLRQRWWTAVLAHNWVCAGLVMLALGLWRIGRPEVWRDELASWSAAHRPLGQLWAMVHHVDASSAAYYLLLHGWIRVAGDSPAMLRLPSTLAMAGAAACVALGASAWFGRTAGLWAGLLFALLPIVSRYAQEARQYAFGVLAAALAGWLLVRALRRPSWPAWAGYAAAIAMLVATNMVAGCLLLGHLAGILIWTWHRSPTRAGSRVGRPVVRWALAVGAAMVAVSPVMWLAVGESGRQVGWLPVPQLATVYALPARLVGSSLLAGAVVLVAALALGGRRRRQALVLLAATVLPLAAIYLISRRQSYWYPRYLLFLLPGLAALAGATLSRVRLPGALVGLALIGLLGLPDQHAVRIPGAHDAPEYPAPSWNVPVLYTPVTALVGRGQRPGDGRLYLDADSWWAYDLAFDYHLGGHQPAAVCRAATGVQRADLWPAPDTDYDRCLGPAPRLWIVRPGDRRADLLAGTGLPADRLTDLRTDLVDRYRLDSVRYQDGTTIALYTRRS